MRSVPPPEVLNPWRLSLAALEGPGSRLVAMDVFGFLRPCMLYYFLLFSCFFGRQRLAVLKKNLSGENGSVKKKLLSNSSIHQIYIYIYILL